MDIRNANLDEIHEESDLPKILIIRDVLNSFITESELKTHLRNLKTHKASDRDEIGAEFLKYAESLLTCPLVCLYKLNLECGNFPVQWSEGIINLLHKSGNKADPVNYRKITVLVTLGKLFESILNGRLISKNDMFEEDDIFQGGLCQNKRTNDAFIPVRPIETQKFLVKLLYVCFEDFYQSVRLC